MFLTFAGLQEGLSGNGPGNCFRALFCFFVYGIWDFAFLRTPTHTHNSKRSMNLISEILKPLAQFQEESCEVCSSEKMLAKIDQLNQELKDTGPQDQEESLVLIGVDAEALYPNLKKKGSAEIVAKEFLECSLEVKTNWREVATYVALNSSRYQE